MCLKWKFQTSCLGSPVRHSVFVCKNLSLIQCLFISLGDFHCLREQLFRLLNENVFIFRYSEPMQFPLKSVQVPSLRDCPNQFRLLNTDISIFINKFERSFLFASYLSCLSRYEY